jgi:predicted acylesterase/phospholipase RssA
MDTTENLENQQIHPPKKIKHIVISGGGTDGFISYGILRESQKYGFWEKDDIESIYGTSIGAIFSIIISLKFDWDTLDDYIIKRPWHTVFTFDMNSILNSFSSWLAF